MFKTILFIQIIFSCCYFHSKVASAQDFGAFGTKWYYTLDHFLDPGIDYVEVESIGDTLISGHACHHLQVVHGDDCSFIDSNALVYEDSGIVYRYLPSINQFSVLYNFNLVSGDILKGYVDGFAGLDSFWLEIISVTADTINGHALKKFNVQNLTIWSFSATAYDTIIEGIGSIAYLFPQFGACDTGTHGLRCYEEGLFGFYSTNIAPSCDYVSTGINETSSASAIRLVPNPTSSIIYLEGKISPHVSLQVSDLSGKILWREDSFTEASIDLTSFPAGIYFLKVKQGNAEREMKVVKQ